jgi:crotonobetainyl-CoA:carnitine CoA-transferase CaiB-like acyl-CoA transferase
MLTELAAAGVPASPVNSVAEAFSDPQVAARHVVITTDHPVLGAVRSVATPLRVGAWDAKPPSRAPLRGEHVNEILAGLLGYDEAKIADLRDEGAFGKEPE